MGVMPCNREGCDNIMCNTYIPDFGYICTECQQEFKDLLGEDSYNPGHILAELMKFRDSSKNFSMSNTPITINQFFDKF